MPPLAICGFGNIFLSACPDRVGRTMAKWLMIALTAMALGGCVAERWPLPLALAPSDTTQAACIGDAGAPAFGDCKVFVEPGATSDSQ
jgi:hypothetical protein